MKIAIIVRSLKFGGMERAACNQADAFYQAGHSVDLIYFSNKNKNIAPKEKDVNIIYLNLYEKMKRQPLGFVWNFFAKFINIFFRGTYPVIRGLYTSSIFKIELNNLEKETKYDLILLRGQGTFEQVWRFKEDRVVKICVNVSRRTTSSFKDKLISKAYYSNSNVNCIADGTKKYFYDKFKRENIHPNTLISIKNPFFRDELIRLSKETEEIIDEDYILGLGRLVKAKNFQLLIESYKILVEKYNIKQKLVLVGEGSEKSSLKKLIKDLKIEEKVIFVGYQRNPYKWMANSSIIVLTSKFEGLCNVLIEAMCCKTRIVINECPGGMKELMIGELKKNIAKPEKEDIAKKVLDSLQMDKSYYYDDYNNLLDSLLPSKIVNEWIDTYIKRV